MKKTLLFSMLFAIMALALAYCNKEEEPELPEPPEETLDVTFNLFFPTTDDTKQTKATNITRYIMEVYKADNPASVIKRVEQAGTTIIVSLETNINYVCLFWADGVALNNNSIGTYNATDLKNVTLNAGKEMDEAFFARLDITDKTTSFTVRLKRPTAQVNIITTEAVAANTDLKVTYKQYNSFSAYTSAVVGTEVSTSKTFNSATTIGTLGTFLTFASVVGIITDVTTLYNSTATNDMGHVPLKANYITNIRGKFGVASQNFTFIIVADETWESETSGVEINVGTTASPKWIKVADRNADKNGQSGATTSNTATDYGCYYQWSNANNAPTNINRAYHACYSFGSGSGSWRLPTQTEWTTIIGNSGMNHNIDASRKLKWNSGPAWKLYDERVGQTDKFVYLPMAGYIEGNYGTSGGGSGVSIFGSYWTSTTNGNAAWRAFFNNGGYSDGYSGSWSDGFSIRCVKDL